MRIYSSGRVRGIPQNEEELKEYLYHSRVIRGECWLHLKKLRKGYALVRYKKGIHNVSRLSAHLFHNLNLNSKNLHALHKAECKFKCCWNPNHIYVELIPII